MVHDLMCLWLQQLENKSETKVGGTSRSLQFMRESLFYFISFFMSLYLSTSDGCVWCSVYLFGSLCDIYPCLPSAPIETNLTPLLAMKSKALFTLLILWTLILPRSGLGNLSPAGIKHTGKKRWSLFEAWKAGLNLVRTGKVIAMETEVAIKMWAIEGPKFIIGWKQLKRLSTMPQRNRFPATNCN